MTRPPAQSSNDAYNLTAVLTDISRTSPAVTSRLSRCREIDAFGDEHGIEGDFGSGQQVNPALQCGQPVFLGTVVDVAHFLDGVEAPVVGRSMLTEMSKSRSPSARKKPNGSMTDAAVAAEDHGAVELVHVDRPRLDDVQGQPAGHPHKAETQFLDVVAADLLARLCRWASPGRSCR